MKDRSLEEFIDVLPKAELHVHIGGTLEPGLMFEIARRNNKPIRYETVQELKAAYQFNNLQEFLDLFHMGTSVLMREEDYYEMTWAYMQKIHTQNVVHTEIFFDAQTHTDRGVAFSTVIGGIHRAVREAKEKFGITALLIPSFLRHLDEQAAFRTFDEALEFREIITGFGLASSEVGHPPSKFERVFERVRQAGFPALAHAGEEGPSSYIWEALRLLKVSRIDHGNRCLEDEELVAELVRRQIPLTLCPLSNLELKVIRDIREHPVKTMLDKGLMVTVNSDDPAYFGGYMNENYLAVAKALNLSREEIVQLAINSFEASFLSDAEKKSHIAQVRAYAA
jgi:adenosine deaminase